MASDKRKFYYHPSRVEAVRGLIENGTLVATNDQLVCDRFMATEDSKGVPVAGWWIDELPPEDWMRIPVVPADIFAYYDELLRFVQMLCGAHS